jgi:hypothetical protein
LAWFLECDPSLARRDGNGELAGFPLPDLWSHYYERRHPEWKRRAEVEGDLHTIAAAEVPGGKLRAIRHRLAGDDGSNLAY